MVQQILSFQIDSETLEFLGNTGTDRVNILGISVEGAGITSIETVGGKYPAARGSYGISALTSQLLNWLKSSESGSFSQLYW